MDIAKDQGISIQQILSNDVISASLLFDGDLRLVVKKIKACQIEPPLDRTQWSSDYTYCTHVVVDFMSHIHQMLVRDISGNQTHVNTTVIVSSVVNDDEVLPAKS